MIIFEGHPIKNYSENMTEDEFFEFCQENSYLQIERDADQNIVVMSPAGYYSGIYESKFITAVTAWAEKDQTGQSFSSSTGFILPNGAVRSPDAGWIHRQKLASIPHEVKKKFLPAVPDFIVEVKSETDSIPRLQDKMKEWIANGVRLGWLVNPENEHIYIYRQTGEPEKLEGFLRTLTGEDVLLGFEFDFRRLSLE
ncbi:MAG: Uma2 family endonuclease [Bacteroidota bacterium]